LKPLAAQHLKSGNIDFLGYPRINNCRGVRGHDDATRQLAVVEREHPQAIDERVKSLPIPGPAREDTVIAIRMIHTPSSAKRRHTSNLKGY
jgi:hypothetical protein